MSAIAAEWHKREEIRATHIAELEVMEAIPDIQRGHHFGRGEDDICLLVIYPDHFGRMKDLVFPGDLKSLDVIVAAQTVAMGHEIDPYLVPVRNCALEARGIDWKLRVTVGAVLIAHAQVKGYKGEPLLLYTNNYICYDLHSG